MEKKPEIQESKEKNIRTSEAELSQAQHNRLLGFGEAEVGTELSNKSS